MGKVQEKTKSSRILALDILRGITIAGMILVNNPGSWSHIYTPLEHAEWNGLTPTDLVFPFFMFIMGVSMYISLRKFEFRPSGVLIRKILRRSVLIYLIGLLIAWFSKCCYGLNSNIPAMEAINNFDHLRLVGVMPRLALCYLFASLAAILLKHKHIVWLTVILLVGYSLLLLFGNGYDFSTDNVIYKVDAAILGVNHMYSGLVVGGVQLEAFDPEGLLSTLPSIAHVLIGFLVGKQIMSIKDNEKRMSDLFIIGVILTFVGFLLSYGLPINKNIWSPTFVITTCGLASSLLGLLVWIIDVKGKKTWCRFFEAFGVNPLFMYVLGGVLGIIFGSTGLKGYIYKDVLCNLLGDVTFASCVYAILFICLNWCIGYVLYKKKIYIKI